MHDCLNEEMRDLLPMLAPGSLPPADEAEVRAHLLSCGQCTADLAALETARLVLSASAPRIDVDAIVRRVSPVLHLVPSGTVPAAVHVREKPRRTWMSRQYLAAAASLLIVSSLSIPLLRGAFDRSEGSTPIDTLVASAPAAVASGFSVAGGLSDLSTDDLTTLLAELDSFEATFATEPTSLREPIVEVPEGM